MKIVNSTQLLLIDDSATVIQAFVSAFRDMGQDVDSILHRRQTMEELVKDIIGTKADIVLLDAQLAHGVRGQDLPPLLLERQPGIRCIGFSSDPEYAPLFLWAGAIGFVRKRMDAPWTSVQEVMEIISGRAK